MAEEKKNIIPAHMGKGKKNYCGICDFEYPESELVENNGVPFVCKWCVDEPTAGEENE